MMAGHAAYRRTTLALPGATAEDAEPGQADGEQGERHRFGHAHGRRRSRGGRGPFLRACANAPPPAPPRRGGGAPGAGGSIICELALMLPVMPDPNAMV